ncbi:MAG: hypothetical protein CSA33_07335 [Desulfobulbus propionicus]|nr:MAG: hypothetical protein CSA33_07335 [Desulfobulbus propionicus]
MSFFANSPHFSRPEGELRPGNQHRQKGFIPFMERVLKKARILTMKKLLVRLDSAHDAIATRIPLRKAAKTSSLIKFTLHRATWVTR